MGSSVKLHSHAGKKYKRTVGIIVLVFAFFLSSRWVFKEPQIIKDFPIGSVSNQNGRNIEITNRAFFEDTNLLVFSFLIETNSTQSLEDLTAVVKKSRTDSKGYPVEMLKVNEEYYVVFVSGLDKKWKNVVIEIMSKQQAKEEFSGAEKFYFASEKIEREQVYRKHNQPYYEMEFLHFVEKNSLKKIKALNKTIENKQSKIKKLEELIRNLEAGKSIETDKETESTKNQITSNESHIVALENEIEEHKKEQIDLDIKIGKVKVRMTEVEGKVK